MFVNLVLATLSVSVDRRRRRAKHWVCRLQQWSPVTRSAQMLQMPRLLPKLPTQKPQVIWHSQTALRRQEHLETRWWYVLEKRPYQGETVKTGERCQWRVGNLVDVRSADGEEERKKLAPDRESKRISLKRSVHVMFAISAAFRVHLVITNTEPTEEMLHSLWMKLAKTILPGVPCDPVQRSFLLEQPASRQPCRLQIFAWHWLHEENCRIQSLRLIHQRWNAWPVMLE